MQAPAAALSPAAVLQPGDDARPREGRARAHSACSTSTSPTAAPAARSTHEWIVQRLRRLHAARLVRLRSGRGLQRQQVQGRAERADRRRAALPRLRHRRRETAPTSSTTSSAGSASSSPASRARNHGTVYGSLCPRDLGRNPVQQSGSRRGLRRSRHRTRRITTKKERKETLMTYRVKNITIAVVLALVAALLTSSTSTNYQRNVRKDETNVPVLVAMRDIPAGTSGAESSGRDAREERGRRAATSCRARSRTRPGRRAGRLTQPIYAGEQVSTRRFSTPSQRGIRPS